MSLALYSSFEDRELAERIVGTLLDIGVIPEDISLVTLLHDTQPRLIDPMYEPALQMIDAGKSSLAEIRYGTVSLEAEGSDLYESQIGGGISTIEPDDDVSGPEEMDDSESVTEDFVQPVRGASFSSEEFRDADSFAQFGSINVLRPRVAMPPDSEVPPISEISAIAEPGLLILGDGHLSLELLALTLNGYRDTPISALKKALKRVGVPEDAANVLSSAIAGKGAVLSVVETVGAVRIEQIESVVEASQAKNVCTFLIESRDSS